MSRFQPRRSDPYGPSDDSNWQVFFITLSHGLLVIIGWSVMSGTPEGSALSTTAGLLLIVAMVNGVGWLMELFNRSMLRVETRGYDER